MIIYNVHMIIYVGLYCTHDYLAIMYT